jgi:hypothetical protein
MQCLKRADALQSCLSRPAVVVIVIGAEGTGFAGDGWVKVNGLKRVNQSFSLASLHLLDSSNQSLTTTALTTQIKTEEEGKKRAW